MDGQLTGVPPKVHNMQKWYLFQSNNSGNATSADVNHGVALRNAIFYSTGIVLCLFFFHFFESTSCWINLR